MGNFKRAANWKFNGYEDTLDSREIIERIEDLEEALSPLHTRELESREDMEAELKALKALAVEGESLDDWEHGVQLIRDSYFEEHARDMASECGLIPESYTWPTSCIDWDQAAYELRMDYTPVEFNGSTYWAR